MDVPSLHPRMSRRSAIRSLVAGSTLFPGLVSELLAESSDPMTPRLPHFPAKAKRVIFLFMSGGVSHVDGFDPKPKLLADDGKSITLGDPHDKKTYTLAKPQWPFRPRGRCGTTVTDLFPHMAECVDDLCVIRSMKEDLGDHYGSTLGMHTGSTSFARPSIGSWISYGLGTFNRNLPSFLVISPALPSTGTVIWSSDFLPGVHQGTRVVPGPEPIRDVKPLSASADIQKSELAWMTAFNRRHLEARGADGALAARLRSFETAFGLQMEAPDVFDLSGESDDTLALYGLKRGEAKGFAWQCLVARRFAERGVRFIELIDTNNSWDAHTDMQTHAPLAKNVDKPIAGLLKDLKRRGMLDETLVVWTSEFGRTPFKEAAFGTDTKVGRGHHSNGFSSWLAGGGVKGGLAYGATDEHGLKVAEKQVHLHDFHATILHLMGLDHTKLTFRHAGRDFRLTDVHGEVVREVTR